MSLSALTLRLHARFPETHKHPEFLPGVDYMSSALQNKLPLRRAVIRGNDGVTGPFTIEIGDPWERDRVRVFASKHRPLDPSNPKDQNPGDMFLWGKNGMRWRKPHDYETALWIIKSVLANGGIYSAAPIQDGLDDF
jgi:hypothetical protein